MERTWNAHAGLHGVVPHAGRSVPAPRGRTTGLLLAVWAVAFVGLSLAGAGCRPADDSGTDGNSGNECAEIQHRQPGTRCEDDG